MENAATAQMQIGDANEIQDTKYTCSSQWLTQLLLPRWFIWAQSSWGVEIGRKSNCICPAVMIDILQPVAVTIATSEVIEIILLKYKIDKNNRT